jgi:hypothetical protein
MSESCDTRIRARLTRGVSLAGWTHRDYLGALHEAAGRSGLPVARSGRGGFRIVAGPPLPPGCSSRCEYADFIMERPWPATGFAARFAPALPEALGLAWCRRVPPRTPHLRASVLRMWYTLRGRFAPEPARRFTGASSWPARREHKERVVDLKVFVSRLEVHPGFMIAGIEVRAEGTLKPLELVNAIWQMAPGDLDDMAVERTAMDLVPPPWPGVIMASGPRTGELQ